MASTKQSAVYSPEFRAEAVRLARLMRQAGLVGCHQRHSAPVRTTRRDLAATPAPDLVERSFAAPAAFSIGLCGTSRLGALGYHADIWGRMSYTVHEIRATP